MRDGVDGSKMGIRRATSRKLRDAKPRRDEGHPANVRPWRMAAAVCMVERPPEPREETKMP